MTFDFSIQWDRFLEALKTENIIRTVSTVDPIVLLQDPYVLIPVLAITAALFFLKFRKTLVFLAGILVFWYACVHLLPEEGELKLQDIATFGTTCVLVLGTWIYFFFIKAE